MSTPGELAAALRPFVCPPARLPPAAAQGAPAVLPGLVMATAVFGGDRVDFLPVSSMADLGGTTAVWLQAMRNVEHLDGVDVIREACKPERDDTDLVTLSGDDPFVASRVAVLEWLIEHLFGATAPHGVVVALPRWRKLILHKVTGIGVLTALESIALASDHWFREAADSDGISPDVYFVSPDRRAQRVAYHDPAQGLVINTTGLLGEVLFGQPPTGLGLTA